MKWNKKHYMDTLTKKTFKTLNNTTNMDKLPREIRDMVYHRFLYTTNDLTNAINKNDLKTVQKICNIHKKIWQMDWNLGLKEAVHVGNLEMVKLMIDRGAYEFPTAFTIAHDKGYLDIARLLYKTMWGESGDTPDFLEYYNSF